MDRGPWKGLWPLEFFLTPSQILHSSFFQSRILTNLSQCGHNFYLQHHSGLNLICAVAEAHLGSWCPEWKSMFFICCPNNLTLSPRPSCISFAVTHYKLSRVPRASLISYFDIKLITSQLLWGRLSLILS